MSRAARGEFSVPRAAAPLALTIPPETSMGRKDSLGLPQKGDVSPVAEIVVFAAGRSVFYVRLTC